jgi:hypothetical protein
MYRLSKNLTLTEATHSETAKRRLIDNKPSEDVLSKMKAVAEHIFQPVRDYFNRPVGVSSFYRSPELNKAIGGSAKSQHCKGEAIDIDADIYGEITNRMIFTYVMNNLEFDQLIWELGDDDNPAWVHVSWKWKGNRKQVLRTKKSKDENGQYFMEYELISNGKGSKNETS